MSSMLLSDQVALSTVSERDALHALPMGFVYMYCYCNHIYSIILQRGFCRGISKSVCNEPIIANSKNVFVVVTVYSSLWEVPF